MIKGRLRIVHLSTLLWLGIVLDFRRAGVSLRILCFAFLDYWVPLAESFGMPTVNCKAIYIQQLFG